MIKFNWKKFIVNGLFNEFHELNVNEDEHILVYKLSYLKNAAKLLDDASKKNKEFKNYLNFNF